MNETAFIIQNRLREATVSLERANFIVCGAEWACDTSHPPFSSIGLVLQGDGTYCIDGQILHPHAGPVSYTHLDVYKRQIIQIRKTCSR